MKIFSYASDLAMLTPIANRFDSHCHCLISLSRLITSNKMKSKHILKLAAILLACVFPALAQQSSDAPRALTASDYARAERWMGYNTNPLVFGAGIRPAWQGDDRFWYRV